MEKIILLTAPSGAGKSTIAKYLMAEFPNQLTFSVSAATRAPRKQEIDGVDYYFISIDAFKEKIADNQFAEWEMVYEGSYYGTLHQEIQRIWDNSKVPVLDIDVKGAIKMQALFADRAFSIFIQPPTLEDLRIRLEKRGTETPQSLDQRLTKAAYELSFKDAFSCIIVNDHLEEACKKAKEKIEEFLKTK